MVTDQHVGVIEFWKQATYGQKIDSEMRLKEQHHPIQTVAEESWAAALPPCTCRRRCMKVKTLTTLATPVWAGIMPLSSYGLGSVTLLEAALHAVWRRPSDGQLLDLNPRELHFSHIHFLPDPAHPYQGRQVDNVRCALCNDAKLKQFIYLKGRQFALRNSGDLANHHGVIDRSVASPRLIKEIDAITKQLNMLVPALGKLARSRQP